MYIEYEEKQEIFFQECVSITLQVRFGQIPLFLGFVLRVVEEESFDKRPILATGEVEYKYQRDIREDKGLLLQEVTFSLEVKLKILG